MFKPMEGVRVLEVAQYTFVPAAGAVLADWGAEVIKVEHAERGDAQRGITKTFGLGVVKDGESFAPIVDAPNRGKRSIGLALEKPECRAVLEELVRRSDVFLTNFLPGARKKLAIDVEDIRAINPNIIYAVGSGFGYTGPESDKGGYDATGYWARGGSADLCTPPGAPYPTQQPTGAYGDNIGGMTIAGGIAAALFARAQTGHAAVVDIPLLGVGAWATQFSLNLALMNGGPLPKPAPKPRGNAANPLVGNFRTADDRWLMLSMLQPGKYWPEFVRTIGHPELATDERFDSAEKLIANYEEAGEIIAEIISTRTKDEWVSAFDGMEGQWSFMQDSWEVANDESLKALGMIHDIVDADGIPRKLVGSPVHFDRTAPTIERAPLFAEHTDAILTDLGFSEEDVLNMKIAGAVT